MSDDRFYCRSGSKFFALCLLLISSVFFSWSAWNGDFHPFYFRFPFSATSIVKEFFWELLTTGFHLFQKWFYGVTIVRSLQKCFNPENDFLAFVCF